MTFTHLFINSLCIAISANSWLTFICCHSLFKLNPRLPINDSFIFLWYSRKSGLNNFLREGFLSLQVIYGLFFVIAQETDFLNRQFYMFNLFLFAYLNKFQYLLGLALANCLYNSVIGVPLGKKRLINSKFYFSSLVGLFSNQPYDWILNKFKTVEEVKKELILYLLKGLRENFIEKSRFLFGLCVTIINFVGVFLNPTLMDFLSILQCLKYLNFGKALVIFKTIPTKQLVFLFLSLLAYKFYFLWLQNVPKPLVSKYFS